MKKILLTLLFQILLLVAIFAILILNSYENNTIREGGGYGFEIGADKLTTYKVAHTSIQATERGMTFVFVEVKASDVLSEDIGVQTGTEILVETSLNESGFLFFEPQDTWTFYINGSRFNTLKLKFCGEQLCEIHRHRKEFELP